VVELMVGRPVMTWWWLKTRCRENEKRGKHRESGRNREEVDFLAYFGPDFILPQAMKSTSIYRRWKREIFSTQEKTFQPLIRLGRIPTVGLK
jgi:hypothetical protein